MSYESTLFLCKRKSAKSKSVIQISEFDLGAICYPDWDLPYHKMLCNLFTEPLNSTIVVDGETVDEDKYGDELKIASVDKVVKYLKSFVRRNEEHRYARWSLEEIQDTLADRKDIDKLFFVYFGY